jgi:hypothetical protein
MRVNGNPKSVMSRITRVTTRADVVSSRLDDVEALLSVLPSDTLVVLS